MRLSTFAVIALLCLVAGAHSVQATQATVSHGVSLRGDPSTRHAAIGHLRKGALARGPALHGLLSRADG